MRMMAMNGMMNGANPAMMGGGGVAPGMMGGGGVAPGMMAGGGFAPAMMAGVAGQPLAQVGPSELPGLILHQSLSERSLPPESDRHFFFKTIIFKKAIIKEKAITN